MSRLARSPTSIQFLRRPFDSASAFLHCLSERHKVSDTEFLTDVGGYLTVPARLKLDGGLNFSEWNIIKE